jgi:ribosome biogenesis GTPase / thiamine phosphate phosphatase
MHRLPAGGWLIDTPGMRELQLADAGEGIDAVFADIVAIARDCRFADCGHDSEPGCAVRAAIDAGALDPDRLARYRKLAREDRRNSEAIWRRRARERGFGKMVKGIMKEKRGRFEDG